VAKIKRPAFPYETATSLSDSAACSRLDRAELPQFLTWLVACYAEPMMSFLRALSFSLLAVAWCSGCASSYLSPAAQVPMFTKAGQVEVGGAVRPLAPRRDVDLQAVAAVTDHLRAGVDLSGAFMNHMATVSDNVKQEPKRLMAGYAEASVGAEGALGRFRYGNMLGAGLGASDWRFRRCEIGPGSGRCQWSPHAVRTHYLRAYTQPYFGLVARRWLGALGARVPYTQDLWRKGGAEHRFVSAEPFISNSVLLGRSLRIELQVMYSQASQVHFHLGFKGRFGPSEI
jgi:hypothetical protein